MPQMQWGLVLLRKPDLFPLSSGESPVPLFCPGLQEIDVFSLAPWYKGLSTPFTRWLWPGEWGVVISSLLPGRANTAKQLPFALAGEVRISAGSRDHCKAFQKLFCTCAQTIPPTPGHKFIFQNYLWMCKIYFASLLMFPWNKGSTLCLE